MDHLNHLAEFAVVLAATVCFVPLFRRAGLSPILGYLFAGMAIGPHAFAFIENQETVGILAQFGVVFLMFVIGLELSFQRLIRMPPRLFGIGIAQVILTTLVLTAMCMLAGLSPSAAIVVGGGLSLSSTAVVLELIHESSEKMTKPGRLALATLILQDLAVIPLLVLVPLLAMEGSLAAALGEATIKALFGLVGIVVIGRLLLRPLFQFITRHDHQELFTATTLLVVLGLAYISQLAGLSPALGAFMGGLLVAETEFKPQVEADIMPFKSLFLGLFFTTVGMSINLSLVEDSIDVILGLTLALLAIKALIIYALCVVAKLPRGAALHSALLLAQGGEFAFVLLSLASSGAILSDYIAQILTACITLSMALTPFLHTAGKKLASMVDRPTQLPRSLPMRELIEVRDHVVIAGCGRVGRVVAQLLEAERIPYIGLDMDAGVVGIMREQGKPVYYGDASRGIVLKAAGLANAQAVIISHNDARASHHAISAIRKLHPNIPIIARARNFEQVVQLEQAGASLALAEMLEISLQLGGALLRQMGVPEVEVSRMVETFRAEDYALTRSADTSVTRAPENKAADYTI